MEALRATLRPPVPSHAARRYIGRTLREDVLADDRPRHHRRSIRLPGHDYGSPGAYFVTICTAQREALFGRIAGGAMVLNPLGRIVNATWHAIPDYFPHVTLDAWVVMPDHVHGILVLARRASAAGRPSTGRARGTTPGSLPAIVQSLKAVSARRINQLRGTTGRRVWQEDYYEHIVRDTADLERIRRYIAANPARWPG